MRIAQRFSVGPVSGGEEVPKGRQKAFSHCRRSAVPSGLETGCGQSPTLKRWAIIGSPSGTAIRRLIVTILTALTLCWASTSVSAQTNYLYKTDFEKAEIGKVPEDFLVLEGGFAVREAEGNRFLELPGTPLDSYTVQFGPAGRAGLSVSARIRSTSVGRRFPTFGVGLSGAAGFRLQISPAKQQLELYKDQELKGSAPFDWKSGQWTLLTLQIRADSAGGFVIEGKAWTQNEPEPKAWMIFVKDSDEPNSGRPSVFGSPFSSKPLQFDDFVVRASSSGGG